MNEPKVVKELDREREEALCRALDFHTRFDAVTAEQVIATAKKFHRFLVGKK